MPRLRASSLVLGTSAALALASSHLASAATCSTVGPDLVVDGAAASCTLAGVHAFTTVQVINGGVITVGTFDGADRVGTGNLELRAQTITVDATSKILAIGAGYQTPICGNGSGPAAFPASGGRGGCAIRDSGGGGGHFGGGGRGTKDNPVTFPNDFEEDCGNSVAVSGSGAVSCTNVTDCRNSDGLPTVAGASFVHSIYTPEFGAAGGDKGCRDGDGKTLSTGGGGGGRIVLVSLAGAGQITIAGTLDATGHRGCGDGNDSGGGGAGGTVLVVGDNVSIAATAVISAAGGLGGDTQGLSTDPTQECGPPFQQNKQADDCGGGGGGGIVSVLSVNADIADEAVFRVGGGLGGVSTLCTGEAGGGVGELQISGGFVGELCDGLDNDFDDAVDEGFPMLTCGATTMPSCLNGVPQQCPPDVPACEGPVTDSRARFAVIVDTSGSMLETPPGVPTFGDGSLGHLGLDNDGNGRADDSRLFKAKSALTDVISAYPDIDFALARYHQDEAVNRSCQMAHNFECEDICCSYDNPTNNTGSAAVPACNVRVGSGSVAVLDTSPGDEECINYAGTCGAPRRGADVLVGFGADINQYLMWLDGSESHFDATATTGNFCNFAGGGDCELRGTGPTPLASSLEAVEDFLTPIKACDRAAIGTCRHYGTILLTDGAEDCQGDPAAAATALRAKGIDTFVIGFSVLGSEQAQLNAIAAAGGTGSAFLASDKDGLANALATIVSGSVVFETCNGLDDDCDGKIDEDFPQKGDACDNGKLGTCRGTGHLVCSANGAGLTCAIDTPGGNPTAEVCNGLDDNCNGAIDDGISCTPGCTPTGPDVCNGLDDDCDGAIDEGDPEVGKACGVSDVAPCKLGTQVCVAGAIVCEGNTDPTTEVCNGVDDNCDGSADENAPCPTSDSCVQGGCRVPCNDGEFACPGGLECVTVPAGKFCVPSPCAHCTDKEICDNDTCVDPCAGVTCPTEQECRFGSCVDCNVLGCPSGEVCSASTCIANPCANVDCASGCTGALGCSCNDGACVANCDSSLCPTGTACDATGACVASTCAGVVCGADKVCVDGTCAADRCTDVTCKAGEACSDGACIDDPCNLVSCSDGYTCRVAAGAAVCEPTTPGGKTRVYAGGAGCDAGGGAGGLGGGGLGVLLALAAATRRRRLS